MFFSAKTNGFYLNAIHGKNIPGDALEITNEYHATMIEGQSQGKIIVADENGFPVLQDFPSTPVDVFLSRVKDELRATRSDILDAVTGIGFRASISGNTELAKEAAQVSQQLLGITDDPALNAAQTYDAMRAAGVDAYRRIADAVSAELRTAFKQLEA